MKNFLEDISTIEGCQVKVQLSHKIFGQQTAHIDKLRLINDDTRLGFYAGNQELYIPKKDIRRFNHQNNTYLFGNENETIKIINKL